MKKKKSSAFLVIFLAVSMVMIYLFGFLLKQTVFLGNPMYQDMPVPALPYILLFDTKFQGQLLAERENHLISDDRQEAERETSPVQIVETEPAETEAPLWEESVPEESVPEIPQNITYVIGKVDPDYFDDVLFIGDSRTDGLSLYSPLGKADYFANKGVTVFDLFDITDKSGQKKLETLLQEKTYGKIYIMLGINEIGYDFRSVISQYSKVLDRLKELAPDSILVIQASLSITKEKSQATWYLTADRIHELNEMQSGLADGEKVFYLDANEIFCDEAGYLRDELSGDGVHLYAKEYAAWAAWMCENAYVPETASE